MARALSALRRRDDDHELAQGYEEFTGPGNRLFAGEENSAISCPS
ncbi:hypothetical protein ACFXJ8_24100 [Nonomuraea sp. NPDC059194]